MSLCKLTVCFEEPFWIGLIEKEDDGAYSVAKHVFGAEPTTPEVFSFVCDHWNDLRFTHDVQVEVRQSKRINPKRLQRMSEKEGKAKARPGTRAPQTRAELREMAIEASKALSRERRDELKREQFAKRTEKRKQKHRGH